MIVRIGIQKFFFLLLTILILFVSYIFVDFYFKQQEKKASVVLSSIKSQISEASYMLSKSLNSKKSVEASLPLLERLSANNDFVASIIIHDSGKVLLSTDPSYTTILQTDKFLDSKSSAYKRLTQDDGLEDNIYFYKGSEKEMLYLFFVFDKDEISETFTTAKKYQFMMAFFLPLSIIFLIWLMINKFTVKPLEKLRQYAYYQGSVPQQFFIKELETIRYSMVETFQRLDTEKKELYEIARRDDLSGLANRNALFEYLEKLIDHSERKKSEFAVLFLDLDHFKSVNDSLGHNVGDALLKKVAKIIEDVLRSNDFVSRVGGDEFVIVLQDYSSLREITNIIDRIQLTLEETRVILSYPIQTSSSIGIAIYPKDGDNIVSLMQNSDIAMYEAKKNGRSQYHFFTQALNKRVQDTIKLEKEMRAALKNDEFELYYQPKVNIKSGTIVGAEALIRWNSPQKGLISPTQFIPLAEENGFIVELGKWVFLTAAKQQVSFYEAGIEIKISINLSSKQLLEVDFMQFFKKAMKESHAMADFIDIEITEYMFYEQSDANKDILISLHNEGVSISLDDFGTGYSSLSYLKDFPLDYLKIDKAFIDDIDNARGRTFVDTIVKMGQTLQMKVIAEGVEEQEQLEYLQSIGCDEYQGYYMSKPLAVEDFIEFYLKKKRVNFHLKN